MALSAGKIDSFRRSRSRVLFYVEDAIRPHAQLQAGFVLSFYASIFGHKKKVTEEIIERLQLREFLRARVSDLSKGTAKRLLIGLGLLSTQPILMLDEPFDGLDLKQMLEVVRLLREIFGRQGPRFLGHGCTGSKNNRP